MTNVITIKKLADLRRIPVGTELVLVRNLRGPCHEPRRVDQVTTTGIWFQRLDDAKPREAYARPWLRFPKAKDFRATPDGFEILVKGKVGVRYVLEHPRVPATAGAEPIAVTEHVTETCAERVVDGLLVSVVMTPPKRGEFGWWVPADATAAEALDSVIHGRIPDDSPVTAHGYGWRSTRDYDAEPDENDDTIAVIVAVHTPRDVLRDITREVSDVIRDIVVTHDVAMVSAINALTREVNALIYERRDKHATCTHAEVEASTTESCKRVASAAWALLVAGYVPPASSRLRWYLDAYRAMGGVS